MQSPLRTACPVAESHTPFPPPPSNQAWEKDMVDKKAVANMYEDAEVFQSNILESRQAEHAAEVIAAEERARAFQKQKKASEVVLMHHAVWLVIVKTDHSRSKAR